ncbi:hypothetical protein FQN57_001678 [Myotisia sp. PD_48]|nr:hypothetical protein FQN57_001678 [Myotisia sp. PD_48]
MLEDDIYKTSTQYRLWSFTEDSLRSIRANTNNAASQRVRAAVQRARDARERQSGENTPNPTDGEAGTPSPIPMAEIECLTPDEEYELVRYYCEKAMELGDEYKPALSTSVRATAIQYLRRFYLTNSPMTYHPKSIMPCALFLATKTDNFYMSLHSFAEHIPNSSTEGIIAPEFLLTQGLRFTFDVRHPFRGLEGGMMELNAIAQGEGIPGPHHPEQTPASLQKLFESLPSSNTTSSSSSIDLTARLRRAHHDTREILKHAAQLTDVYFLYTPSQIWLAAFLIADKPLAETYLDTKLGVLPPSSLAGSAGSSRNPSDHPAAVLSALRTKLTSVLQSCVDMLNAYRTSAGASDPKKLKRIAKKLYHCQNPEKLDLVALNKLQKSGGSYVPFAQDSARSASASTPGGVEDEVERAAKKRKVEAEDPKSNVFGAEVVR